jgi:acetolactate synthase small subunit
MKKKIIASVVLAVVVGLFAYLVYTVHTLSVAVNDNAQWKIAATGLINAHTQNIQQMVAAINKLDQSILKK